MHDIKIIKALQQHEEQGLQDLIRRYTPLFRYIISPILQNSQDQEECLSEIYMRVWDKIHQYDFQSGNWTGWLTAIARNAALNRVRSTRSAKSLNDLEENLPSKEPTPEEQAILQERREALLRALRTLSDAEQILFYRKYYYLQSTAQIASELGMTERAVEGRLYRIKRRLRKTLGGDDVE